VSNVKLFTGPVIASNLCACGETPKVLKKFLAIFCATITADGEEKIASISTAEPDRNGELSRDKTRPFEVGNSPTRNRRA
jgi:hypothetical protein